MSSTFSVMQRMPDQLSSSTVTTTISEMQKTAALVNAMNIEARVYLKLNYPTIAKTTCQELLKHDPKNIYALNTYNTACCSMSHFKDISESIKTVTDNFDKLSEPEQVMHLNNCAQVSYAEKDYFASRYALLNSIHLQPQNPQSYLLIDRLKQDYAEDWFSENDLNAKQFKKALFYLMDQRIDQAFEIGKKLFTADPQSTFAQYIQIFCNLAASPAKHKEAFEIANRLLVENPEDNYALKLRAYCSYFFDFHYCKCDLDVILVMEPKNQLFDKINTLIQDFEKKGTVPALCERISALESSCVYTSHKPKVLPPIPLSLADIKPAQSYNEAIFNYAWCLIEQGKCQAALMEAKKLRRLS